MKGLVLSAQWDPRPDYRVSEWERATGKAVTGSSVWRRPRLSLETLADPRLGPGCLRRFLALIDVLFSRLTAGGFEMGIGIKDRLRAGAPGKAEDHADR